MLLCSAWLTPFSLEAANGTFNRNGSSTPYQWGDAANWTSSLIANGAGSYAFLSNFNVTLNPLTVNLDSNRTLGHLVIGDRDNATRFAVNLTATNSSVLTFDNHGDTSYLVQGSASSANTISANLSLMNDLRIRNLVPVSDNSQRLILAGGIAGGSAGDQVITLGGVPSIVLNTAPYSSGPSTSAVQINGTISDGVGKVSLVIDNPTGGLTVLNGSNTFSGGVTLKDGGLELNHIDTLGSGVFTIKGGAIMATGSQRLTFNAGGKNMVLAGDFTAQNTITLDLASTGTIKLEKSVNVSVIGGQFALLGAVSDGGAGHAISKTGTGIFYFSNNSNSFGGGLDILGGRIIIGNAATLGTGPISLNYGAGAGLYNVNVNQAFINRFTTDSVGFVGTYGQANPVTANVDLSGYAGLVFGATSNTMIYNGNLTAHEGRYKLASWSGTSTIFNRALVGEGSVVEVGAIGTSTGTVIFNAENTYTGTTTLLGPTTLVLQGASGGIAQSSAIRLQGASTFQYSTAGASGDIVDVLGELILGGGDATLNQNRVTNHRSTLEFLSMTRESGGTLNLTLSGTDVTASENRVYFAGLEATTPFINAGVFWNHNQYAAFDGQQYVRGLEYGSDAGTSIVASDSALSAAVGTHVNIQASVTSTGSLALETLRLDGGFDFTQMPDSVLTLNAGGLLKVGANNSTISGGSITSGDQELIVRTTHTSDNLFIRSNILSSSTQGLTKSGPGVVTLSGQNEYEGPTTVNNGTLRFLGTEALGSGDIILNGGSFDLRERTRSGDLANNAMETIVVGNDVVVQGSSSLVVSSVDGSARFQNKTLQFGNLTIGGQQLSISNANGFGVEFAGTTTLSKGTFGETLFNIANARPSPMTPGLTLSGKVTGESRITVKGNGTLLLTNETNDFLGDLWVTQGFLAASNDGAFGHESNRIFLIDATVSSGLRAVDTFETERVIKLGNSVSNRNLLHVSSGHTLTLHTAFDGVGGFVKGDNGTLVLNQDNAGWDGTVMILDGVVEIRHDRALGTTDGVTHVGNIGAALHLAGNLSLDEEISIYQQGVNSSGAIYSRSGQSTLNGKIHLLGETSIGVAQGSTLTFGSTSKIALDPTSMPVYTGNDLYRLTLTGEGDGVIKSSMDLGNNMLLKHGSGTWTLEENFSNARDIQVLNGALILAGEQGSVTHQNNRVVVSSGAKLVLDNRESSKNNRLGGMALSLGGELLILGQADQDHLETLSGVLQITGNGHSILTMDSVGNGRVKLDLIHGSSGVSRFGQGTLLVRGNQLGAGDVAGSSTFTSRVRPTLMGNQNAADTIYQGILSWALADDSASGHGDSFATYDSVKGFRALNRQEQTRDFAKNANVRTEQEHEFTGPAEIASLQLETGGGVLNVSVQDLTIISGGILAKAGNFGIHGGTLRSTGATDLVIHALGDLDISSAIVQANGGLTKAGEGTLTLSNLAYYQGHTSVNQGTLKLNGGDHTLLSQGHLYLNAGGIVDLNGYHQTVGSIRTLGSSAGEAPTLGGKIVNTGNNATFVTNLGAASNFSGTFEGDFNFVRSNTHLLEATSDWGHQGATLINGGITRLTNQGRISQSEKLHLSYGSLQLHNNGTTVHNDRLADDMDIQMDGAVLSLYGRAGSMTTERVGNVHAQSGMNVMTASGGTNNANMLPQSSILTLRSFSRSHEHAATVNFGQSYNGTSSERLGLNYSSTGSTMNILVEGGVDTVNHLVGPWAIYSGFYTYSALELVGYSEASGFSSLNTSGYYGYDASAMPSSSAENSNIRHLGSSNVAAGGLTIHAASIIGNANHLVSTLSFANRTDLLTVKGGVLAFSIEANDSGMRHTVGSTLNEGRITSGYASHNQLVDLYLWHQNNNLNTDLTINSAIVDNAALNKSLRLVLNSANFGQYPFLLASDQNNYTGGTVVNNTAVRVSGRLGTGGITLNGGNMTQLSGGVIGNQRVTLNGASTLTLTGSNTLQGLNFNNTGGSIPSHSPTISTQFTTFYATRLNVGMGGTLKLDGNINATSSNVGSTSLIENGMIDLNGADRTINVGAIEWLGDVLAPDQATLEITSSIGSSGHHGVIKTGDGWLKLSGDNSFAGDLVVQAGGILLGNDNALGYGTLVLHDETRLSSGTLNQSIFTAVDIRGDIELGSRSNAGALAIYGDVAWGDAHHTITVNSHASVQQDLSGTITGSGGITKQGSGTLVLNGFNTGSLDWSGSQAIRVEGGRLSLSYAETLGDAPTQTVADNIVLNGGALDVLGSFELDAHRGIAVGAASGGGRGTIEVSNGDASLTYGGVIRDHGSEGGSFVKTGAGSLILTGQSTYTGDTFISQGYVAISGEGSINATRHLHVAHNAMLDVSQSAQQLVRGSAQSLVLTGMVRGNTTLTGTGRLEVVSQRAANSAIFIEGDLNTSSESRLRFHLQDPSFKSLNNFAGFGYGNEDYHQYLTQVELPDYETSRLVITGEFLVENGTTIEVVLGEHAPEFGNIYDLVDWGSLTSSTERMRSGSEAQLFQFDLPSLAALGLSWDMSHFASRGILVVIPEPGRALLILLALSALALRRRR